jgi:release factor glutamine methyltransferase
MALSRQEIDLLTAHILRVPRRRLALDRTLTEHQAAQLADLIDQREQGIPLQYLLGSAPFRYLEVAVGPGVFIPRPETELILDIAAQALSRAQLVLDLGSGSGAIALAVATEYLDIEVIAVERAPAALGWLRRNVAALCPRVQIIDTDIAELLKMAPLLGAVDVVLSNPPYVPDRLRSTVPAEVRHDPDDAVFAGSDGLDAIRTVIGSAAVLLRPGGLVVIEHDESHQDDVRALFSSAAGAWLGVTGHRDLTGRPRFVAAVRQDVSS